MAKNQVTVQLIGYSKIARKLKSIPDSMAAAASSAILDSSLAIMNDARTRAPVRKLGKVIGGRLRASINVNFYVNGLAAEIGTNVEYARFVEFGTGQRGAATNVWKTSLPNDYIYGSRMGMAAQPYLFPAFVAERENFQKNLRKALRKGIETA